MGDAQKSQNGGGVKRHTRPIRLTTVAMLTLLVTLAACAPPVSTEELQSTLDDLRPSGFLVVHEGTIQDGLGPEYGETWTASLEMADAVDRLLHAAGDENHEVDLRERHDDYVLLAGGDSDIGWSLTIEPADDGVTVGAFAFQAQPDRQPWLGWGELLIVASILATLVLAIVPVVWAVIDVAGHPAEAFDGVVGTRRGWIAVLVLLVPFGVGWIAAVVYFATVRPRVRNRAPISAE